MSFHLYRINELFSSADGSVQFIELTVGPFNGESFWQGQSVTASAGGITHSFTFPTNLPSFITANTSVLLATQGFANLGTVTPDFILPAGFLFTGGGTVNYAGVDIVNYGPLPTDGTHSVGRDGTVAIETPKDFAGITGGVPLPPNTAPSLSHAVPDQQAQEGALFSFQVPLNTFFDPDAGDTLAYSAALANGAALPAWFGFDPATRAFSGIPGHGDVGAIDVRVTAADAGGSSASDVFTVAVAVAADSRPTMLHELTASLATVNLPWQFDVPAGTFDDADPGDAFTYRATLADGSRLPAWISVDATSGHLSGTPGAGDAGVLTLRVVITDRAGAWAYDDVSLAVAGPGAILPPYVDQSMPDGRGIAGQPFALQLPAHTLVSADGSALAFSATRADGSALPAWLAFDAHDQTFFGTPAASDAGLLSIQVSGMGAGGLSASDVFTVAIGTASAPGPGTSGSDTLMGTPGSDTLAGAAGDDALYGGAGNDTIDGGAGLDEAWFGSMRFANTITRQPGGDVSIQGVDGSDLLHDVERAVFSDVAVGFDVDGTGGKAYRLYQAAFDRTPDDAGVGFWMYYLDRGFSFTQAAAGFIASAEFTSLYGANPTNDQFTQRLYQNVLHRDPDQDGYDFWNAALTGGSWQGQPFGQVFSRADVLVQFSESVENKANVIGAIADGFNYLPWHG